MKKDCVDSKTAAPHNGCNRLRPDMNGMNENHSLEALASQRKNGGIAKKMIGTSKGTIELELEGRFQYAVVNRKDFWEWVFWEIWTGVLIGLCELNECCAVCGVEWLSGGRGEIVTREIESGARTGLTEYESFGNVLTNIWRFGIETVEGLDFGKS